MGESSVSSLPLMIFKSKHEYRVKIAFYTAKLEVLD
jgi:hypothetical protein